MSEKLLNTRLISYITKKNFTGISNDSTQGKSTETAIHDFLESVQQAIQKKHNNMTVSSSDLSKAYDVFCFIN